MNEIRYLLDENVNPILLSALLRNAPNLIVWQVGMLGAPELGTLDPEILIWCEENGFILVTNNRQSMPVHLEDHLATGRHAAGIFVLNAEMSVGETVDELVFIATASSAEEYQDQIIYLPISRFMRRGRLYDHSRRAQLARTHAQYLLEIDELKKDDLNKSPLLWKCGGGGET